ncbi:MAG: glycosyltransferase family 39 protein [Acidobacteriota bacterium]
MPTATPPPASRSAVKDLLLLVLVAGAFFVLPSWNRPLWTPDEGRYAEIPREMVQRGDWVTPRLNGVKYFEKPPLLYWLTAASIETCGIREWALRAWPWAFAVAGCALAYGLARKLWGRRAGLLAGLVLATSPLYYFLSTVLILDMAVSVLLAATLAAFLLAVDEDDARRRRLLLAAMYVAAALATLAKGLIGAALPGLIILVWLVISRRWAVLRRCGLPWGVPLYLAIAAPWHLLASARNPEFAYFYFIHEHFLRYTTTIHERQEPFWFFAPILLVGMLPWIVLVPQAFGGFLRRFRRRAAGADRELFLWLWAGLIFLFFSASDSKLVPYILPVLPPLAVLLGARLDRMLAGGERAPAAGWTLVVLGIVLAAPFLGLPFLVDHVAALEHQVAKLGGALPPGSTWRALAVGAGFLATGLGGLALARPLARRGVLALAGGGGVLLVALATVPPLLDPSRTVKPLALALDAHLAPGDEVITYRDYPQDLPVYLGRTVTIAEYKGELRFGTTVEDTSRWMIDEPEFWRRWLSGERKWLVLRAADLERLTRQGRGTFRPVFRWGPHLLLTNRAD